MKKQYRYKKYEKVISELESNGFSKLSESKTFNAITGQASAAALIAKNLADNFDKVNEIDGEAFASNLDISPS